MNLYFYDAIVVPVYSLLERNDSEVDGMKAIEFGWTLGEGKSGVIWSDFSFTQYSVQ